MTQPQSAPLVDIVPTDTSPTNVPENDAGSNDASASATGSVAPPPTRERKTRSTTAKSSQTSRSRPAPTDPLCEFPEIKPDLELIVDGSLYLIPQDHLAQYLRFTADQLVAVQAMRAAGVDEATVAQAFPKSALPPAQLPVEAAPGATAPAPAPGTETVIVVSKHGGPFCTGQMLDARTGNVVCTGCQEVLIPGTGRSQKIYEGMPPMPAHNKYRSPVALAAGSEWTG